MKVLHFYKTSVPESVGGIEQVIHQIGLGAAKQGVQTDVLSLTCGHVPRTVDVGGYLVHRARMDLQIASTGFSISALLRFYQLARQANVIHYHFPWPFMDVVHFATMVNKPTVVTYHSDIIRQKHLLKVYRPLKHCFLRDVDRIVATSPNYLETSEVLGRYRDKVSVIPIGLDRETYPEATPERLNFWRSKVGSRFFLFVGVLRYYKGLHILMEAAKGGQFPIVIVGAGPIELELRTQARNLGLSNVLFFGQLPEIDKVALLELSYAVVFPSHLRSEAFGISLLEGAMFGKPMISSEIGTGTTFINIANETGLVVPPSDPSALRGAMDYLWAHPDKAEEMGARALQRYWRHFTAERMVADYVDLYREVLEPEPRTLP
ncbi:glycosyl transferase family 1 [Pseudomonas sp. 1D4]|uniref:glycosyltransferase family 4 protein n=1 Tax=Pseudomonadaceae TaxID=135621 RepID=UPI00084BB1ED|nr:MULTISPECIES: glycosyltransferase family 4 protein [Pseudomonas]OEC38126.1 glycosyl transferase family 1 [Pseudomonas sp. 1D4]